ncbi:MAG: molybdate ABC transporter substrate-binding protein [Clostridiales bacterium]|nr:molybdate ABC transporter substrate-binding protein [Clostridiales bacterium]
MKKFAALFLSGVVVASLAACGATNTDGTEGAGREAQVPTDTQSAGSGTGAADIVSSEGAAGDETEPLQSGESVSGESAVGAVSGEEVELTVFAAASMTETMNEIANLYKEVAPNVSIVYTFDSSGTLVTQITEGADCDLFISAAQKQMNQIDVNGGEENTDGLDLVLEDTRVDLLENKVVLVTADNSDSGITSFEDIASDKLNMLCIGNEDVPVGAYSLKILDYLGTSAQALEDEGKLTYGSNVKEVTTQVLEGVVDCGIIYATDAFSAGLTPVDEATADMCGRVIYPAAVLKNSKHSEEAKAFLEYLKSDEASAVFESVGFTPIS